MTREQAETQALDEIVALGMSILGITDRGLYESLHCRWYLSERTDKPTLGYMTSDGKLVEHEF